MQVSRRHDRHGPDGRPRPHAARGVARLMSERRVGAAVVMDPDGHGPGIITERDILLAVGAGRGPGRRVGRRASDARRRLRRAGLVARGGRRGDGARRLPPSDRRSTRRRDGRDPVGARHRALLDRGRRDLSGARAGWPWGEGEVAAVRPPGADARLAGRAVACAAQRRVACCERAIRVAVCASGVRSGWALTTAARGQLSLVRVERELVDFAARVFDPAHDAHDRQDPADHRELDERRHADQRQRDARPRSAPAGSLGPGRWISSPTGGTSGSSGAHET